MCGGRWKCSGGMVDRIDLVIRVDSGAGFWAGVGGII